MQFLAIMFVKKLQALIMIVLNDKEIGNRIRRARKEKGMSQEKLGELLCWDQPQISRIECGKDVRSLDKLCLLAEALDKHYLWFLEGDEIMDYCKRQLKGNVTWKRLPEKKGE